MDNWTFFLMRLGRQGLCLPTFSPQVKFDLAESLNKHDVPLDVVDSRKE